MSRVIGLLSFTTAILISASSHGEPGPLVNWLMNEPVSVWDMGVREIRERAQNAKPLVGLDGTSFFGAHYDWDKNRLIVSVARFGGSDGTEEMCAEARATLIGAVFLIFDDTKDKKETLATSLSTYFSHEGYEKKAKPEKLGKRLADIVEVEVSLNTKDKQWIKCSGAAYDLKPSVRRD